MTRPSPQPQNAPKNDPPTASNTMAAQSLVARSPRSPADRNDAILPIVKYTTMGDVRMATTNGATHV